MQWLTWMCVLPLYFINRHLHHRAEMCSLLRRFATVFEYEISMRRGILVVPWVLSFVFVAQYILVRGRVNFGQAKLLCLRHRGRLAQVTNAAENSAVLRLFNGVTKGQVYWLGLNDVSREGRWVWNDGPSVAYRLVVGLSWPCESVSNVLWSFSFQLLGSWRAKQLG